MYDREWCAANGTEEADWTIAAGLKTPFLQLFGLTCGDVKSQGDCDTPVEDLSTKDLSGTQQASAGQTQQECLLDVFEYRTVRDIYVYITVIVLSCTYPERKGTRKISFSLGWWWW